MEFIFVFCSLLVCLLVVKIIKNPKISKTKLPPGPKKLPFIGNLHQLCSSSLPHHTLRNLANKHGALMHLQLGELPVIVVSSPEIAKEVLRTHDLIFANRPYKEASWIVTYNHSDIAFAPYGDLWRQLRKICILELLSPKRVQSFGCIREDEVSHMIRSSIMSKQGQVLNLSRIIFSLSYGLLSRAAFGKKSKYNDQFIALVDDITQLIGGFHITDMFPSVKILQLITRGCTQKIQKLHNQVDKIVETILNEHREKVANHEFSEEAKDHDLVDILLSIQRHGQSDVPLTDTIIKGVIYDMFSAGGETSATTMEWAISELVRNPTFMEKAQVEVRKVFHDRGDVHESKLDELKYLQAVIKETLRLHPAAVLLIPRESSEQCEINGYEIPAKTTVLINAWAMGRDPKYWIHADKFDPDRFLDSKIEYKGNHLEYIPFGSGRRICPGISFAIPSLQLTLAQLLFHFDWKLPGGVIPQELDMTEKFGLTVRRQKNLELIPITYRHSCLIGKK